VRALDETAKTNKTYECPCDFQSRLAKSLVQTSTRCAVSRVIVLVVVPAFVFDVRRHQPVLVPELSPRENSWRLANPINIA